MNAMILAAGRGERLRPLTLTVPKPAIPVLGRPILTQVLSGLARQGVRRAAVNLHHLPHVLRDLLADPSVFGLETLTLFEEKREILGTGGGIRNAEAALRGGGTIVVRNADFLADVPLDEAAASHRRSGLPATLVVAPHRAGYTALDLDAAGRVVSIGGDPPADPSRVAATAMFLGLHFIEEDVLDLIPAGRPGDIVRDVYRGLAARGALGSWMHRGLFWEFGAPRDYLDGSLLLLGLGSDDRKRLGDMDPVRPVGDATVAMGPGVDLHAGGITLSGRLALGFATRVGEGASIEDSVVMPEAWIGPGSRLRRTIVGMATEVPAGFEASEVLLCSDTDPGVALPAGVARLGGLLMRSL